jgi:hypothetical protein
MRSWIACRSWLPSGRLIVIVNGLNPPAWLLVVPAVKDGENGRGLSHGLPFGPAVTLNVDEESTVPLAVHGSIEATVVYGPHKAGVLNGARSPPKKCSSKSSNGS